MYASCQDLIRHTHEAGTGFHNDGPVLFGPDGFPGVGIVDLSTGQLIQSHNMALVGGVVRLDVNSSGGERSHPPRFHREGTVTQGYFVRSHSALAARNDVFVESWAWGPRNPHPMRFDPESGALWLGALSDDEIKIMVKVVRGFQAP